MRLIISRAVDQPKWDLDVLLNAFDNEIEARERCEPIGTNPIDPLINQSEESVTCTFCKQGHSSAGCVLSLISKPEETFWNERATALFVYAATIW